MAHKGKAVVAPLPSSSYQWHALTFGTLSYLLITCGAFELVTVLVEVVCYFIVSINPIWVFGVHVCSTCLWLAEVALFSAANGLTAYLIKSKNLVSTDGLYLHGTASSFIASLETFIILSL